MILYKYYSNLDYALGDIRKKKVHLSKPENFNDGFEASLYDEDLNQYITIDGLYILCLSPFYLNQNMWGVYANSEKGICVGYRVPDEQINSVRYTNALITKATIDEAINNANVAHGNIFLDENMTYRKKYALLKSEDWEHEQEYRIIMDSTDSNIIGEKGDFYIELDAVAVYAGRKLNQRQDNFQKLLKLCKNLSIDVFEIKQAVNRRCLELGQQLSYVESSEE